MARPHAAAIVEDAWHRRLEPCCAAAAGDPDVAHTGYGSEEFARVLGRVLLTRRPRTSPPPTPRATAQLRSAEDEQRGWRAFITAPAMDVPVHVTVGDKTVHTRTDRSGYIDVRGQAATGSSPAGTRRPDHAGGPSDGGRGVHGRRRRRRRSGSSATSTTPSSRPRCPGR